jgi:Alpha/beta hydrolase domain
LNSSINSTPTPYTVYQGRIFGTLDPNDPHNTIITDINLAPKTNGKVAYIANFQIVTPTNASDRSGLLIYGVSNRGGNAIPVPTATSQGSLIQGATYVQSGWQGDLLAECSLLTPAPYPCVDLNAGHYGTLTPTTKPDGTTFTTFTAPTVANEVPNTTRLTSYVIQVPVATTDGQAPNGKNTITGPVYSHVAPKTSGPTAQLIITNAPSVGGVFTPYQPASLNTSQATLWSEASQTLGGVDTDKQTLPSGAWSWAYCPNGGAGTPSTTWICLNGGFDPNRLYEIVFTAANPLVLGVGYAATRDLVSFLHYGNDAPGGGSNPLSGTVNKTLIVGSSQSGAFIRGGIFYGFNEDENGRIVFIGANPQIDGRMLWLNERFAQPTVLLQLYMGGNEAPVWWANSPNDARHLGANGLLRRCKQNNTCPEILEWWGELEYYGEKMGPDMTGYCVVCRSDLPVPQNVHRFFHPGTSHGGGAGGVTGFTWSPPPAALPFNSNQQYPSNPNPERETNAALLAAFIQFLMMGAPMPADTPGQAWPTVRHGQLVANNAADVGFPNIPGFPYGGNNAWPPIVYDFGPGVDYDQQTGVASVQPPNVLQVLTPYVPHVNSDGNADGGSVPSVLFQAPLGTYTGWNIIPSPSPYAGQQASLSGGFWPFWDTKANRIAHNDPRPSLEERYGTNQGYICVVTAAANRNVAKGFLLVSDANAIVSQANQGNVLKSPFVPTPDDIKLANSLCSSPNAQAITAKGWIH